MLELLATVVPFVDFVEPLREPGGDALLRTGESSRREARGEIICETPDPLLSNGASEPRLETDVTEVTDASLRSGLGEVSGSSE